MSIRIGTRKSPLALKQVEELISDLARKGHGLTAEIVGIDTTGDRDKITSIEKVEGSNFFTDEIEYALLRGEIDIAVHSAKDLPDFLLPGLTLAALTEGKSSRDCLVSRDNTKFADLAFGARIGTSSRRRKEDVERARGDLRLVDVRGTIGERIALIENREIDALIVAEAALIRLGLVHLVADFLPFDTPFLQGRLAVETRENDADFTNLFESIDCRKTFGAVYLVGAGPGDPSLITVKGLHLLERAEVVLYDALIDESLLRLSKASHKIFVGKRKGAHSALQDEINSMMVRYAGAGKTVVRLKGGDPCVFGRLWEEVGALRKNFIRYEIVPGITAAQGACAYAEIPLTRRGTSSSFSICTGYPESSIAVPESDMLVYYMAAGSLSVVVRRIMEKGFSVDTPACIVMACTTPKQSKLTGTLGYFSTHDTRYDSPLVFIVGKIALQTEKSWFEKKKKVLVTGTTSERYAHLGEIVHDPMIECVPVEPDAEGKRAFESLSEFSAILFTSKHAVHATFGLLVGMHKDARSLSRVKIFAIGEVTARALASCLLLPDVIPQSQCWLGLAEEMRKREMTSENILFPRSDLADPAIVTALEEMGNRVTPVVVYETRAVSETKKVDLSNIDTIVFTSPSCVRNFRKKYGSIPHGIEVVAPGDVTLQEVLNGTITAVP